ncbi:MAG: LysM domain-containing protein [Polyangia bacterium]
MRRLCAQGTRRLALCVLLLAPSQAAAEAGPRLVDYVVRAGDTCHGVARKLYGDARRTGLIHRHNPQLGKSPHHLSAGQVLKVPERDEPQTESEPDARLTFLRNQVEAYTPEYHAGRLQEPLLAGSRVGTLGRSLAEVTFLDETQMQLGENSLLAVLGSSSERSRLSRRASGEQASLLRGALRAFLSQGPGAGGQVAPAAGPEGGVAVKTPGAQVRTAGAGELQVSVDAASTTRLAVYSGRSRLTAKGQGVDVAAGFGSKAELGKRPTPARPLPEAPRFVEGPAALVLTLGEPVPITLRYAGAPADERSVRWHRQLGRDARLNDALIDEVVAGEQTTLRSQPLPAGRYFVRVSAIDADQFEGAPRSRELRVVAVQHAPARDAQPAQVEVPQELFCGLDEQPLHRQAAPLRLGADRAHTLRCALRDGAPAAEIAELLLPRSAAPLPPVRTAVPAPRRAATFTLAAEPPRSLETRPAQTEQAIVLRVFDQEGAPVDVRPEDVTVAAGPRVARAPVRRIGAGELRAALRWPAGEEGGTVRITLRGAPRSLSLLLGQSPEPARR